MSEPQNPIPEAAQRLERMLDMPLTVRLVLGECSMEINQIMQLGQGSLIELKDTGPGLELWVEERRIARAETVVSEGKVAARITEVASLENRFLDLTQKS